MNPRPDPSWRARTEHHVHANFGRHLDSDPTRRAEDTAYLTQRLHEMVEASTLRVRVKPRHLLRIAKAKRLMNVYETGEVHSSADLYRRKELEKEFFRYPLNLRAKNRPTYGYLCGTERRGRELRKYGDLALILNGDVRSRTAFTVGDSLDTALSGGGGINPNIAPSRLDDPHWTSAWFIGERDDPNPFQVGPDFDFLPFYVEATIHGGVRVTDVAYTENVGWADTSDMQKLVRDAGLSWTVT